MSARFATTMAVGDPASLAERCIAGMPVTDGATLGILYTTEPAAAVLPEIARALAEHTGIRSWVGGVGLGICSASDEIFDQPAAVAITRDSVNPNRMPISPPTIEINTASVRN